MSLTILSCFFASAASAGSEGADSLGLYGAWRWISSSGGLAGARQTPTTCSCQRVLVLKPGGEYEYSEQDSAHEYLLCKGSLIVHRYDQSASHGKHTDFWITVGDWWIDYERDLLVWFVGHDTLFAYPGSPGSGVDDALTHSFVRYPGFVAHDSLVVEKTRHWPQQVREQLPEEGAFVYYEEEPQVVTAVQPEYPASARAAGIQGKVILHVLVGRDGRVKRVKVIHSVPGLDEAATNALWKWVFKPARSNNKPVAVWVEVPMQIPPQRTQDAGTGCYGASSSAAADPRN